MMKQSNTNGRHLPVSGRWGNEPDAFYSRVTDDDLRAFLMRREQEIYASADDVLDGWLGMAQAFHKAKTRLVVTSAPGVSSRASLWGAWVEERFSGLVNMTMADRLAEIGKLGREELADLRGTYFQKTGSIYAIATYLSAPDEVKEQVKSGDVKPTGADILKAVKEAEEAKRRAEDAEYHARQAMAKLEERIEAMRAEMDREQRIAIQEATARLQREIDEARHQAELRKRDTDEAQRQVQRAQAEWDTRLKDATSKATEQERTRLEREYTAQMRDLEKQLEAQRQAARRAERDVNALTARLENARDSEAVRARWGMLAATMVKMLDGWLAEFPTAADAQYFEAHERTLTESVVKRLRVMLSRVTELEHSSATIIDAG